MNYHPSCVPCSNYTQTGKRLATCYLSGLSGILRYMSLGFDDQLDNMRGALRLLLAHLNGLLPYQWDWKPSPACRSIRDILLHMSETYEDRAELEKELTLPIPDVARVQVLFGDAAEGDYQKLLLRYADTPLDAEMYISGGDFFLGRERVRAGTLLARRVWEECYHAGQVVYIRFATDPDWDQEGEVYGLRPTWDAEI